MTTHPVTKPSHPAGAGWAGPLPADPDWLARLLAPLSDPLFLTDRAGVIRFASHGVGDLPSEQLVGVPIATVLPAEHRPYLVDAVRSAVRDRVSAEYEVAERTDDGVEVWCHGRATPLVECGEVSGVVLVVRDVTDAHRTADRLAATEVRYQNLFEDAPDMYFTVAADGTIRNVNRFGATSLGYRKSELIGQPVNMIVHPEDRERIGRQVANIFEECVLRSELEFRKVRKDGSMLWVRERSRLVFTDGGGSPELRIVCRDITARKLAEEALAESEERHRLTLDAVSSGGRDWNVQTGDVLYSNRWIEELGYERRQVVPHISFWRGLIHPDDRARVEQALEEHLRGATPFFECEYRVRTGSGAYRWHRDRGRVVAWGSDGRPLRMVGTDTDITQRREAEEALRESEARLAEAQRLTHIGSWEWHLARDEVHWSDELYRIFGLEPGQVAPSLAAYAERVHPEDRETFLMLMEETRTRGTPCMIEHRAYTLDGGLRHIHAEGTLVRGPDGASLRLIGTAQDITERKRFEERLRASLQEKELLLREVHHRVKNNLQVISSLLRLHMHHVTDESTRAAFLQTQNRVRAIALVHEALLQTDDLANVDAQQYVGRLVTHLRTAFTEQHRVTVTTDIAPMTLSIDRCIACGLIASELIANAVAHAFPAPRTGTVHVELVAAGDGWIRLVVGDDGVGLPDGVDIREPGSLGLELVNTFVDQLGGSLSVKRDRGTVFEILAPAGEGS